MKENIEKRSTISSTNIPETSFRLCNWPSCGLEGLYRAPISQDRIREYNWFCLEHVRIYNSTWSYYEGISVQEFDDLVNPTDMISPK